MAVDLGRDQREEPLGVGVASDELHAGAELRLECGQTLDHAVVGEQATGLLERVRVAQLQGAGRGEADVGYERRGGDLPRLVRERSVAERGERLFVDVRRAVRVEVAESGPVRLATALGAQRVRRLQQPERRGDGLRARAQTEEAAHAPESVNFSLVPAV